MQGSHSLEMREEPDSVELLCIACNKKLKADCVCYPYASIMIIIQERK